MANLTNAVKQHILENYQKYDVTNSKEEMLGLLNVLEAYGKTLDDLHQASSDEETEFCNVILQKPAKSVRELAEVLLEYNIFYVSKEKFTERMKQLAKELDMTEEEYMKSISFHKTSDGIVVEIGC